MAENISTLSIPPKVKIAGVEASKQVFGNKKGNLSGYVAMLITEDCRKRGIKIERDE